MATKVLTGATLTPGGRDAEGHRTYKVKFKVISDTPNTDGPATVLRTPGLFIVGAVWAFGGAEVDLWAWCRADATITPVDPPVVTQWEVEQTFSSKPPDRKKSRCQDLPITDPILEPPKVSGSFVTYTEEATYDRFGNAILTSSHEIIRGPQVEFDKNRPQVKIEKNYASLNLNLIAPLIDTVNQYPMWGLSPRMIKLSTASWERVYEGSCSPYYKWTFNFDVRYDTFDRDLLDEGNKVLNGDWDTNSGRWILQKIGGRLPNPSNPSHFCRFKDRNGENCRVVLNGAGLPADVNTGTGSGTGSTADGGPGNVHVEKYSESDFSFLNLPVSF